MLPLQSWNPDVVTTTKRYTFGALHEMCRPFAHTVIDLAGDSVQLDDNSDGDDGSLGDSRIDSRVSPAATTATSFLGRRRAGSGSGAGPVETLPTLSLEVGTELANAVAKLSTRLNEYATLLESEPVEMEDDRYGPAQLLHAAATAVLSRVRAKYPTGEDRARYVIAKVNDTIKGLRVEANGAVSPADMLTRRAAAVKSIADAIAGSD